MGSTLRNDTATFLDITAQLLAAGYCVRFRAHGGSMRPTIRHGETVVVEQVDSADVKAGDILLYRCQQRPLAHRVVQIHKDGNTVAAFMLRGDAKAACDAPVTPPQVLGRVFTTKSGDTKGTLSYLWALFVGLVRSARRHQPAAPFAIRQT
jgi:signal peptidase I